MGAKNEMCGGCINATNRARHMAYCPLHAAAPELLEALKRVAACSVPQSVATKDTWIKAGQEWLQAAISARAAIAKTKVQ
jgi:hypothetical protein